MRYPLFLTLVVVLILGSCKPETPKISKNGELHIAIKKDPRKLNPLIYSATPARLVFQYMFTSLADFHPETLELIPILIDKIPEGEVIKEGKDAGNVKYVIDIVENATWEDGTPITGEDYLFTLKAIKHPETDAATYRSYFTHLIDANIDPDNPRRIIVIFDEFYMLSKEIVATLNIYPKHIYDPESALDGISVAIFNESEKISAKIAQDSTLTIFAKNFNSVKYSRDIVSGAGPYKLVDWVADQIVVLERKENYWAADSDNPYLMAGPKRLIFHIIPDELNIINQLKSGAIDLYPSVTASEFVKLQENEKYKDRFNYFTPELMRFYFISMNNSSPALADNDVRRAIAHLVDVDEIIELLEAGLAKRTVGIFNRRKNYYNKDLIPIPEDIEKAREILASEGWKDTNNNGTIDKKIDGQLEELKLDMYTTESNLSNKIALLLADNAKKVGIKINIIQKKFSEFRKNNIPTRDYDLFTSVINQDLAPDDPYSKWHSDNDTPSKRNTTSYYSKIADNLIDGIRETTSADVRRGLYLELQKQMYDDQPVIWLYSPLEKIILSKKWKGKGTPKRPGYLANTFTPIN